MRVRLVLLTSLVWITAVFITSFALSNPVVAQTNATVAGRVWNDVNLNGVIDGDESGINGVTIVLYDGVSTCTSVQTSGNGNYEFTGVANGSYSLYEAAGESTPTPAVCPPTETTADINTQNVTLGTIADPNSYASTTANRIELTISGGANLAAQNFGDHAAPSLLTCPSDAFLYQQKPSDFYGVNLVTGGSFVIRNDWSITTNGVGFNLLDDYLYGFVTGSNGYISRTDGNGDIVSLKVQGLGNVGAYVGDVSTHGYLYLNRGRKDVWVVDVNAQRTTYLTVVRSFTTNTNTSIADWAFNAVDGMLYGVRGNGQLVQVNPSSGHLTVIGSTGIPDGGAFGAVYFDVDGYFYASNNGTGKIYRIDLRDPDNLNPTATLFTQGPKSSTNDGARCVFAEVAKLDFGDAPDTYGTTLNANGARHIISVGLFMGSIIDDEDDGLTSANADGDDLNKQDDEDGLVGSFAPLAPGAATYSVTVNANNTTGNPAYLVGYLDWNNDGDFDDAGERASTVTVNANGNYTVEWTVPSRPTPNPTFARFRLSTDQAEVESLIGPAIDGEVEDYPVPSLYPAASLTLVKVASPADGTAFPFSHDVDNSGNFNLADSQSKQFTNLAIGDYQVTELVPAGWRLNSITCSDNTAVVNNPTVQVTLNQDEDVTCTFTNEGLSKIVVQKQTDPSGDPHVFEFSLTGRPDFLLGDGDANETPYLATGTYTITEDIQSLPDWDLADIDCVSSAGTSTFTEDLVAGEAVISLAGADVMTCTYENQKRGTVVVEKNTLGADGTFVFTSTTLTPTFTLTTNNGVASQTFAALLPDTYDVSETVPTGWDQVSATCDDGSDPAAIDLDAGETVTCTFVNEKRGRIVITKETEPDDGTGFGFTDNIAAPNAFSLNHGESQAFELVPTGTYIVTENDPTGINHKLSGITCADDNSSGDPSTRTATIVVDPGETVSCTFTNAQLNVVSVEKVTLPLGAPGTFTFEQTVDSSGNFTLAGGESNEFTLVPSGTYRITETAPSPTFDLTAIDCYDTTGAGLAFSGDLSNGTVTLDLTAGERVHCAFTNTQRGEILIRKATTPTVGAGFVFSQTVDNSGTFVLDGGGEKPFTYVVPGAYVIAEENLPAGWYLDDIACDDGVSQTPSVPDVDNGRVTVNVEPGELVTCTFENVEYGTIIVEKRALGGDDTFSFTSNTLGDFDLTTSGGTAQQPFANLESGIYDVSESAPVGWDLTDVTCDDGSEPDAIDLQPGETVTCTFENSKRGEIVVVKETIGGDGDFEFYSDKLGGFTLSTVSGSASITFTNLISGQYSIAESGPPSGWDLTSATCDSGTPDAITLDPGAKVTCTFENTARGQIDVVKRSIGDDGSFTFTSAILPATIITTTAGIGTDSYALLVPGAYDLQETAQAGWALTASACDDGTPDAIVVTPGVTTTCTFTNTRLATLIVSKFTAPRAADQAFDFSVSGGPDSIDNSFSLKDAESQDIVNLRPGNGYAVAETVPSGWLLAQSICDDGSDPGAIQLDPGETVECVFDNEERGTIIIRKLTEPANTLEFPFTHDMPDQPPSSWTMSNGQFREFVNVASGTYTVVEDARNPAFYARQVVCTDSDSAGVPSSGDVDEQAMTGTATINLDPGETVTCSFVNSNQPLAVTLGWVLAEVNGDTVEVRWQTANESGVAGFNVLAMTEEGLVQLNKELIASPVIDVVSSTDYLATFETDTTTFYLQEVGVDGRTLNHGPFVVGEEDGAYNDPNGVNVAPAVWLPLIVQ